MNDQLFDLRRKLENDAKVEIISIDSEEGVNIARHTLAHILAQAVKKNLWQCQTWGRTCD